MNLHLGSPQAMWLLLLVPVMALIWWRSPIFMAPRPRLWVFGLRAATVTLIVLALCDPRIPRNARGTGQGVAVVLDVSDSLGRAKVDQLAASLHERWGDWRGASGPGAQVDLALMGFEVLSVDPGALPEAPGQGTPDALLEAVREARKGDGKRATNLAGALDHARDTFRPGDAVRLFLVTDGRATRGDTEAALQATKLRGVKVFPVLVDTPAEDPLFVEGMQAPAQVFVGDELTAAVRIASQNDGEVRVTLRRRGTIVATETVQVIRGVTTWSHTMTADAAGSVPLDVQVEPIDVPDGHPENNSFSSFTRVRQVPRLLVGSHRKKGAMALIRALEKANLKVEVRPFSALPASAAGLDPYSAVFLDSPGGQDLTTSQLEAVEAYVDRKGGGLLLSVGKRSLARGTWLREKLENALPVDLVPRAEESPFALYLLLDSSSSMSGAPIAQVKFAAKRIISMMAGRFLGVIHFNAAAHVAVPLQQVRSGLRVRTDIDAIRAAGGTAFSPALERALVELVQLGIPERHVLLLSDGQPSDAHLIRQLYQTIDTEGIKVSTVGIGQNVNRSMLAEIAQRCGGRYYDVRDLSQIVTIFEEEVERLIGPPYDESTFSPVLAKDHALATPWVGKPLPDLHGYVGTTLKKGAQAAMLTPYGDPVLATWQYRLGRVAVWTGDLHGPWSRDWRAWQDGFPRFWEGVVKSIVRSEISSYKLSTRVTSRRATAVVDAVDKEGRFLNGERLELVLHPPTGGAQRVALAQVEEGRYEADFAVDRRGFYGLELLREVGGEDKRETDGGLALGFDPEYHPGPPDRAAMEALASATGGRVLRDLEDVLLELETEDAREREEVTALWPPLAALALVIFLCEVGLRRLGKVFVTDTSKLEGGKATYRRIAESFLKMAQDYDDGGDHARAQAHYLKARSFFLKAENEEQASKMWEKYRRLDRK